MQSGAPVRQVVVAWRRSHKRNASVLHRRTAEYGDKRAAQPCNCLYSKCSAHVPEKPISGDDRHFVEMGWIQRNYLAKR